LKYFILIIILLLQIDGFSQSEGGNMVDEMSFDSTLVLDIRYASENNFLNRKVYDIEACYLQKETAARLASVQLQLIKKGYRLIIFDAYRPRHIQYEMWRLVPDPRYVADPAKGSNHNRGCAVDVSLLTKDGAPVSMPTDFDDLSEKAYHSYNNLTKEVITNRKILKNAMISEGFIPLETEWWHYSDPECYKYPLLNITLSDLKYRK